MPDIITIDIDKITKDLYKMDYNDWEIKFREEYKKKHGEEYDNDVNASSEKIEKVFKDILNIINESAKSIRKASKNTINIKEYGFDDNLGLYYDGVDYGFSFVVNFSKSGEMDKIDIDDYK